MKLLNQIVKEMIEEHEGGSVFFDNLDKEIQKRPITDIMYEMIPEEIAYIIVSGSFGRFFNNEYQKIGSQIITVKGGLRHGDKIDDLSYINLKGKRVIFLDDSYYLGRTRDSIQAEIEKHGGIFVGTIVAYDGSRGTKDPRVRSLYRYHEEKI